MLYVHRNRIDIIFIFCLCISSDSSIMRFGFRVDQEKKIKMLFWHFLLAAVLYENKSIIQMGIHCPTR